MGTLLLAACGDAGTSGTGGAGTTSATGTGAGTASSTGTGTATIHHACDNRMIESTCADFPDGVTKEYAAAHCDGVVLEVACQSSLAVGICKVVLTTGETLTNTYYSDGATPWTEATASNKCTTALMGTFQKP
jgi:hypothetical protein